MTKVKLKGITWDHSRGYDPLVAASTLYASTHNVEISWSKRTLKNFGDQSLVDLSNNFDLIIIDHPHSGMAAAKKCVLPLDEFIPANDFELLRSQSGGPSFDSYHYNGHQWALPIDAAMQTAVYRSDLLKSKVPSTWKEVLQMEHLGMALCPTDSLCSFLTLTAQFGAPIDEQNDFLVPEEMGVEVLDLMKRINAQSHPESINWNPFQLFDYMSENEDVIYAPLAFCYTDYSRDGYRPHRLMFTNPPGMHHSVLGGAGIAVSSKCEAKEEAIAFANWLCSEDIQKGIYVKANGQPANMEAWKDDFANELTHDFFNSILPSLENAYVRPRFENWPTFQEYLGDVVHDCLKNNIDSFKTIKHLNQEFGLIKPS
jgi:multiple sugar transport system substrate-binding protein